MPAQDITLLTYSAHVRFETLSTEMFGYFPQII
jgi:hypothetical protein